MSINRNIYRNENVLDSLSAWFESPKAKRLENVEMLSKRTAHHVLIMNQTIKQINE